MKINIDKYEFLEKKLDKKEIKIKKIKKSKKDFKSN